MQDQQALSVLLASLKAMGGVIPSDSVAAGSIETVAGGQPSQGTIRILTKGLTETLVQITMPDGTRSTVYGNGQASETVSDSVKALPLELAVTSQAPEFPLPFVAALLNDPDMSFRYVGIENSNGTSLQHIQAWKSFKSQPNLQFLCAFSMRDIWIDAASSLPQRISYIRRLARGAVAGVAVDYFYSNYQNSSGVLYPFSIERSLNGTPWATIKINSVALDTGLTDSNFGVQ
ncbi:MAG: hypothetical protein ACRD52_10360 [Candidatus Acidiferrales bacterium]